MKSRIFFSLSALALLLMGFQLLKSPTNCAVSVDEKATPQLTFLETAPAQTVAGNLSEGAKMETLRWAWNSSIACFVEPGDHFYTGNHKLYKIEMPPYSEITITLNTDDKNSKMGLYAYTKAKGSEKLPTEISSCVSCEADPSNNNGTRTGQRQVELRALRNPYSVIIGVAGGDDLSQGGFGLDIKIKSK